MTLSRLVEEITVLVHALVPGADHVFGEKFLQTACGERHLVERGVALAGVGRDACHREPRLDPFGLRPDAGDAIARREVVPQFGEGEAANRVDAVGRLLGPRHPVETLGVADVAVVVVQDAVTIEEEIAGRRRCAGTLS